MRLLSASVFVLAASLCQAADPGLLNLVMPEAKVLAGMQVEQAKASPFGQFLLSRMTGDDANFRSFVERSGFDPRRDLREVVVASVSSQPGSSNLVLFRGTFDVPRILTLAKTEGATVSKYAGIDVIAVPSRRAASATQQNKQQWAALLDNSTAMMGDVELVKAAIDRRRGGPALDSRVISQVNQTSASNDAWFVAMTPPSSLFSRVPDSRVQSAARGDLLQAVEEVYGGIKFGSVVQVRTEALTRSEKDATALGDVVRFLAGLMQQNSAQPGARPFATLLDTLKVETQGKKALINLSIPEAQLETLIRQMSTRGSRTAQLVKPRPRV